MSTLMGSGDIALILFMLYCSGELRVSLVVDLSCCDKSSGTSLIDWIRLAIVSSMGSQGSFWG